MVVKTDQGVVKGRAEDTVHPGQHIPRGMPARGCARAEVDRHGGIAVGVVKVIHPLAAIERVTPRAAIQGVVAIARVDEIVAQPTADGVVTGAAIERVVEDRAEQVFDTNQRVSGRRAASPAAARKVDVHGGG